MINKKKTASNIQKIEKKVVDYKKSELWILFINFYNINNIYYIYNSVYKL